MNRLKEIREYAGITQEDLAEKVFVSDRTIRNAESGRKMSDSVKQSLSGFFGYTNENYIASESDIPSSEKAAQYSQALAAMPSINGDIITLLDKIVGVRLVVLPFCECRYNAPVKDSDGCVLYDDNGILPVRIEWAQVVSFNGSPFCKYHEADNKNIIHEATIEYIVIDCIEFSWGEFFLLCNQLFKITGAYKSRVGANVDNIRRVDNQFRQELENGLDARTVTLAYLVDNEPQGFLGDAGTQALFNASAGTIKRKE